MTVYTLNGSKYQFETQEDKLFVRRNRYEILMLEKPVKVKRFRPMEIVGYRDWEKKDHLTKWKTSIVVKIVRN